MGVGADGIDGGEQGIGVIRIFLLLGVPHLHNGAGVWLLQAELVAREAENLETLVPILTVQLSELSEVKSGQASSASKIADKNCLLILEEGSELGMHFAIHILNRLIEDVLNWQDWLLLCVLRVISGSRSGATD